MSLPRRKNLDVRAEKTVAFYFLPSYDKYIIYILSAISAEDRPTFPVLCISLLQLIQLFILDQHMMVHFCKKAEFCHFSLP